jgi:hypothetical protein
MTALRNTLICFGVFWISTTVALPLGFLFSKLDRGIIYGDSILDALAMGVMLSLGRACAAILAGMFIALTGVGRKPERWALLLAILYVVDAPRHSPWQGLASWYRVCLSVPVILPAVACVCAAWITARTRPASQTPAPTGEPAE